MQKSIRSWVNYMGVLSFLWLALLWGGFLLSLAAFGQGMSGATLSKADVWNILLWPGSLGFIPLAGLAFWAWRNRLVAWITIGLAVCSTLPLLWLLS